MARASLSFLLLGLVTLASLSSSTPVTTLYSASVIDYTFPSAEAREDAIRSGAFIPENNALAGVKVFNGTLFVTIPRWRPGVPSTLNTIDPVSGLLRPYPSWEYNDPSNLQYVQSMEIDSPSSRILDVGRLNIFSDPSLIVNLRPKLIVFDLHHRCEILKYYFPVEVAPSDHSFLNDLVLDEQNGFVYISSTWGNGGLIVFDVKNNRSRRFDDASLQGAEVDYKVGGVTFHQAAPSDGLALSPDLSTLYYCTISTPTIFSISAKILRDFAATNADFAKNVVDHGRKGFSDGLATDSLGRLYFGDFENDSVKVWDPKKPISTAQTLLQDNEICVWADTFAFDEKLQSLVWTTNRLAFFFNNKMDFSGTEINFRILSATIGAKSYMAGQKPYETTRPCLGNEATKADL